MSAKIIVSMCLKTTSDTSMICHEIISVMDIVSTKMANTEATNITKNCHSKKVRDDYILHIVLLAIILLLISIITYYYYYGKTKKL